MRKKFFVLALALVAAAGCSGRAAAPPVGHANQAYPQVRQIGETPVQWRRFAWGSIYGPYYPTIISASDGNLWYTDYSGTQLIRMGMAGGIARFSLPSFNPSSLVQGADNRFYVASQSSAHIDAMTLAGTVTQYNIPSADVGSWDGITLGPDNNVWLTENSHVAKITTGGTVTEFAYTDGTNNNYFGSIVAGPDGNLWATEYGQQKIDKIATNGTMSSFGLACNPTHIISTLGSLWVSCTNNTLLQVSTTGSITATFTNYYTFSSTGNGLAVGPNGNPWFLTGGYVPAVGTFNPGNTSMSYFYAPTNYSYENALATGRDGNVWTVDNYTHTIDVYILKVISVSPSSVSLTAGQKQNVVVTEAGTAAWTGTTSNSAVATVAQGVPANTFVITAVATGTCRIFIADSIGNSFVVHVTVQ